MMKDTKTILNKIRTILAMDPIKEKVVEIVEEVVEEVNLEEAEVKMAESTLENGDVIYYDGTLGVDTPVFSDGDLTVAVADGTFVLDNGDTFEIVEGIVTVFTPFEEEVVEEVVEEEALEEENFEEKYNELKTVVEDLKKKLEKFNETEVQLKAEIEKMSAIPEVESITQKPQDTIELTDIEKRLSTLDAIRKLQKNK